MNGLLPLLPGGFRRGGRVEEVGEEGGVLGDLV